jgi:hypothetical protein
MFYSAEPNRCFPESWQWYCVSTPAVFREYKLPVNDKIMTKEHRKQYKELLHLSEVHGAPITCSNFRRG